MNNEIDNKEQEQDKNDMLLSALYHYKKKIIESDLETLPRKVLALLLSEALTRIDYAENILLQGNEDDERDCFDLWDDKDYILIELFDSAIEKIELVGEE